MFSSHLGTSIMEAAQQSASLFDVLAETVEERAEMVESEPLPAEWEVVFPGGLVNVRSHNSTKSDVLRTLQTGTVVLGIQDGGWLRLSGIKGYMQINTDSSGYIEGERSELLRRREVAYFLAGDPCESEDAYEVPDVAICKHAARWLGQQEAALWFKSGCQVDPAKSGTASSKSPHSTSIAELTEASDAAEEDAAPAPAEEEGEEFAAEEDAAPAPAPAEEDAAPAPAEEAAAPAPEPPPPAAAGEDDGLPLAGRRLRKAAVPGEEASSSTPAPRAAGDGDDWELISKNFKRICSTQPYQADKPMPVRTMTSVTSITTTTTQTTVTTGTMEPWGWPSLFCFAVFRANTPEQDLVKEACRLQAGIFACDTTVTVSGEKIWVGLDKKKRDVFSWVNAVDEVTMGDIANNPGETTNSWLNTQIFINAIDMLVGDELIWQHDWTVKGDPDAVIFPDRIRTHLTNSGTTGTPAFYENCFHDAAWWLYGSIEIFSKQAMERYRDSGQQECQWGIDWKGWGEDMYMDVCMKKLGAAPVTSGSLVGDKYCTPRDCSDGEAAAFHPYKTKDDWRWCLEASTGLSFPAE